MRYKFYLLVICFLSSCTVSNKLTTCAFSSMEEMLFFIKEDFKKSLSDLKDTVYYFPPITSKIPGDTTIIMFGSCKPISFQKTGNEYHIIRKSRVLGDTTIILFPSKSPEIYLTHMVEYYIDRKKLKILYVTGDGFFQ
ncbi:MAG: hypothetical protein Q8L81_14785 [Bacteroidota bacterium]|nr:hypothetical protein [Bacteroidota bacterium]